MNNIQIFFILFLIQYISSDQCGDEFEIKKKNYCNSIEIQEEGNKCYLTNQGCEPHKEYKKCYGSDDDVYTEDDANICRFLSASELKKCAISEGKCTEVLKSCSDFSQEDGPSCTDLDAGDAKKRCYLNINQCEPHYKLCSDVPLAECSKHRPLKTNAEGAIEDDETDPAPQNCILDGQSCKKYDNCGDYKGSDDNVCRSIKPFNDDGSSLEGTYICKLVTIEGVTSCTKSEKTCVDYTKLEGCSSKTVLIEGYACESDDEGKCKEIPKACASYEGNEAKICKLITGQLGSGKENKKCVLNSSGSCEEVSKVCSDYTDKESCEAVPATDHKKCIFIHETCEEVYKSCDDINEDNSVADKQATCKSTLVYKEVSEDTVIDYAKKCSYGHATDGATANTCYEDNIEKCEDYDYGSQEFCSQIAASDSDHKCILINGKCIEQAIDCNKCTDCDKKTCESLVLADESSKCIFVKDKECTSTKKLCSDYSGKKDSECKKYVPYPGTTNNKICSIYNGKCIEQYKYCSDYKGNDEAYCKSIIPYDPDEGDELDDVYQCILDSNFGCMRIARECSKAKNSTQCTSISKAKYPKEDDEKMCLYYNGKCIEEYSKCENYKPTTFVNTECTGIKLGNCEVKEENNKSVCKTKTPTTTDASCSDYQVPIDECASIDMGLQNKCIYSENSCQKVSKSCSEIKSTEKISEDVCSSAPTSNSNKKCVLTKESENSSIFE